ncbi:MAG: hypothetical protein KDB55_08030 [Mycobacterium sp.]|jgi:predicted lipid-binding transport protein (Tim44 family)|nr:hypothetical protein [Mycobacterium sp.]MCB0947352.1 hypothetical protein [Mycobacterium sp.]
MSTPDQQAGFDQQRDVVDPGAAHARDDAVGQAHAAGPHAAHADATTNGESLFGGTDLAGLKARWDDVQAAFVDDPRQCVQKADHLVSDVVERLTSGFAQARTQLEEQWSRGQEASTEELRVAIKRYREFFQRLLSV